ncbi:MAG: hypothetical protein ABEK12_01525 [Candidatus Nanohaloarchaea archaeon]
MRFDFPGEMRPATVEERQQFYRESFPMEEVRDRTARWDVFTPVVDVGSESTRYRPRFKQFRDKLVRLTDWETLDDLHDKIVEYAPEDLYYVTTVEKEDRIEINPEQELVFDLDPERVDCETCDRKRERLPSPAADHVFCMDCFTDLARQTRQLAAFLRTHFDEMQIVYSGRGFHIHIADDAGFMMDREDRIELQTKVSGEFPVSRVTTADDDLVRMPGSLHGLVSRVVTPIGIDDLDDPAAIIRSRSVPGFLRAQV